MKTLQAEQEKFIKKIFNSHSFHEKLNLSLFVKNKKNEIISYLIPCADKFDFNDKKMRQKLKIQLRFNVLNLVFKIIDHNGKEIGFIHCKSAKRGGNYYIHRINLDKTLIDQYLEPILDRLEIFFEKEILQSELLIDTTRLQGKIIHIIREMGYTINTEDKFLFKKNILLSRKKDQKISTAGPSITSLENLYVTDALINGWGDKNSEYLNNFENSFAKYIGSKYAIATSSCTGALHLSLLSLGITQGDEVIVPEITWVATASAVRYVGATPIFADVNEDDWTISIDSIKKLMTKKTKAIIPVHLYGYAANVAEIVTFAKKLGVYVIEDAAPAIGTKLGVNFAGTMGDFGCFSFQGAKMLVTGEGGMLVTNNKKLYSVAKKIQDHGRKPGTFWIDTLGYKYKMSNIQGALGLAQLERVNNQIFRKRQINSWYIEGLKGIEGISIQKELCGTLSICWMTSIKINKKLKISRDEVIFKLRSNGIDSRPVFPAISQYPIWNIDNVPKPIAKEIGDNGINLPSGVNLSKKSVDFVISNLYEILK